mmetsp:Transcript_42190/g.68765  ORF Transcript_42190/g.68765 Transcript_42190/m.68765 type:complete len:525 (-) Transcript_42190:624-2198(-)
MSLQESAIVLGITKIQKNFEGHGLFIGTVVSKNGELYSIRYEDGDEEEMPFDELRPLHYVEAPPPAAPPAEAKPPTEAEAPKAAAKEAEPRKRKHGQVGRPKGSGTRKRGPKRASFDPTKPPAGAQKVKQTGGCVRCTRILQVICNKKGPCDWCTLDSKPCDYFEDEREDEVWDVRCPTTVNQEEIDKARIKIRQEGRRRVAGAALRAKLGFPREVVLTKYHNMGLLVETDNVAKTINVLDVLDQAPAEVKEKLSKGDFILSLDHILAQNLKDCSLIEEALVKHHPLGTTMLLTVARLADETIAKKRSVRTEMLTLHVQKPKSLGLTLIESKSARSITVHRINGDVASEEVKAKFRVGDQIHSINGRDLSTVADVVDAMKAVEVGGALAFTVEREVMDATGGPAVGGEGVTKDVVVTKASDMGLELKLDVKGKRLIIVEVRADAPPEVQQRLAAGDCIVAVNAMTATTRQDLAFLKSKLTETLEDGSEITLRVQTAAYDDDMDDDEAQGKGDYFSPRPSSKQSA